MWAVTTLGLGRPDAKVCGVHVRNHNPF